MFQTSQRTISRASVPTSDATALLLPRLRTLDGAVPTLTGRVHELSISTLVSNVSMIAL
jgi:hypothetical protein